MTALRSAIFCAFVVHSFWTWVLSQDECHPVSGPPGERCVLIPGYDSYQLATCASPSYIATNSNNTLGCTDSCRNYCWFPCMAEKFGALNGSIDSVCNCSGSKAWCLRETGSCTFFKNCLMEEHTCYPPSFAIYGFTLCEMTTAYLQDKDADCTDKSWMRDFRVCLQRQIIPNIYQNTSLNCTQVDDLGFGIVYSCLSDVCLSSVDARTYMIDYLTGWEDGQRFYPNQTSNIQGILNNSCIS